MTETTQEQARRPNHADAKSSAERLIEGHELGDFPEWQRNLAAAYLEFATPAPSPSAPVYYRYRSAIHKGEWMVVLPADVPVDRSGWEIEPLYVTEPPAAKPGAEVTACQRCGASGPSFPGCELPDDCGRHRALIESLERQLDEARARVAELEGALAVPAVWSEEESDGMARAWAAAQGKHGLRETLFAVAAWLLRHRQAALTPPAQTKGEG